MFYEMFWERKDKFGEKAIRGEQVYVLDYKNKKIIKGKVGNFCATIGVFHIWCGETKKDWRDVIATWNDIEPITEEGYQFLQKRIELISQYNKENL